MAAPSSDLSAPPPASSDLSDVSDSEASTLSVHSDEVQPEAVAPKDSTSSDYEDDSSSDSESSYDSDRSMGLRSRAQRHPAKRTERSSDAEYVGQMVSTNGRLKHPFDHLPSEIVTIIFAHLDEIALDTFRRTSLLFSQVAQRPQAQFAFLTRKWPKNYLFFHAVRLNFASPDVVDFIIVNALQAGLDSVPEESHDKVAGAWPWNVQPLHGAGAGSCVCQEARLVARSSLVESKSAPRTEKSRYVHLTLCTELTMARLCAHHRETCRDVWQRSKHH